jgi:hypothetical protein
MSLAQFCISLAQPCTYISNNSLGCLILCFPVNEAEKCGPLQKVASVRV